MTTKPFFNSVSDEAVKHATGKTWKQWFAILDKAGAKKMMHRDIARLIYHKKLPRKGWPASQTSTRGGWWSQMISVGYEQARGLRRPGQKDGMFEISVSSTMNVSATKLYAAWINTKTRNSWLAKKVSIHKSTKPNLRAPKSGAGSASGGTIRFRWPGNNAIVVAALYPKGRAKTQVSIQHGKLNTKTEAARMKLWWKAALQRLAQTSAKS